MKCRSNNSIVREKTKQTCIKKFGVDNPAKSKEIYSKIEETNLKKYGYKHHLASPEIIAKKEKTCLEHYGTPYTGMCKDFKEKRKKTMLERYNVEYTGQSKELMKKVAQTNQQRYGGKAPLCSQQVKNKSEQICRKKYGFKNAKVFKLWITILSWKDFIIPLFDKEHFYGKFNKDHNYIVYNWKCTKCNRIFESRIYSTKHLLKLGQNFLSCPRCEHCYPYINTGTSQMEQELIDFCKIYYPNLLTHNYKIINPYELDIVIPEIKLAIEFNGIYYHSVDKKPLGYHLMKTEMCEKLGYRLLHVWEDEWVNNKQNLKIKLENAILNKDLNFNFVNSELILNRSWYSNILNIVDAKLIKINPPKLIQRREFLVEDCGELIFQKVNKNK